MSAGRPNDVDPVLRLLQEADLDGDAALAAALEELRAGVPAEAPEPAYDVARLMSGRRGRVRWSARSSRRTTTVVVLAIALAGGASAAAASPTFHTVVGRVTTVFDHLVSAPRSAPAGQAPTAKPGMPPGARADPVAGADPLADGDVARRAADRPSPAAGPGPLGPGESGDSSDRGSGTQGGGSGTNGDPGTGADGGIVGHADQSVSEGRPSLGVDEVQGRRGGGQGAQGPQGAQGSKGSDGWRSGSSGSGDGGSGATWPHAGGTASQGSTPRASSDRERAAAPRKSAAPPSAPTPSDDIPATTEASGALDAADAAD